MAGSISISLGAWFSHTERWLLAANRCPTSRAYPYLLPPVIVALVPLTAAIVGYFRLRETLPARLRFSKSTSIQRPLPWHTRYTLGVWSSMCFQVRVAETSRLTPEAHARAGQLHPRLYAAHALHADRNRRTRRFTSRDRSRFRFSLSQHHDHRIPEHPSASRLIRNNATDATQRSGLPARFPSVPAPCDTSEYGAWRTKLGSVRAARLRSTEEVDSN